MKHAPPSIMIDDRGESDLEYFVRRPHARHLFRPTGRVHGDHLVIVIATVTRDDAGRPATISRSLYRYDGGRA